MTILPPLESADHTNISTPPPPSSSSSTPRPCTIPHEFRIGQPSDSGAISVFLRDIFTKTFSHDLPPEDLVEYLDKTYAVEIIEREIRDLNSIWILALSPSSVSDTQAEAGMEGGEILGLVQLKQNSLKDCLTLPNPIELNRIYLSTKTHGKGLSQVILSHAEQLSRERGFESIWLGVYSKHQQGIKFYTKSGFKKCGERIFVVGEEKQMDWVMEKSL